MEAEALKTVIGEGDEAIGAVKNSALLNQRVELKVKSKKIKDLLNRFHVAISKPRDQSLVVDGKFRGRKRERSPSCDSVAMDMDVDQPKKKMRFSSKPRDDMGLKDSAQKLKAVKLMKKSMVVRNKNAKKGEGDRVIVTLKPKHLYSGKRSKGKTHRR